MLSNYTLLVYEIEKILKFCSLEFFCQATSSRIISSWYPNNHYSKSKESNASKQSRFDSQNLPIYKPSDQRFHTRPGQRFTRSRLLIYSIVSLLKRASFKLLRGVDQRGANLRCAPVSRSNVERALVDIAPGTARPYISMWCSHSFKCNHSKELLFFFSIRRLKIKSLIFRFREYFLEYKLIWSLKINRVRLLSYPTYLLLVNIFLIN